MTIAPGGVKLNLSGREIVLPSFSLRLLRHYTEAGAVEKLNDLVKTQRLPTVEEIDLIAEMVEAASKRGADPLAKEELLERIDMGNWGEVLLAVFRATGLEVAKPGAPAGEAASPKS